MYKMLFELNQYINLCALIDEERAFIQEINFMTFNNFHWR